MIALWPPGVGFWRVLVLVMAVALAGTVVARFPVAPDLVAVLVVSVGITAGAVGGAVAGLAAGWLLDLAPPGGHPLGSGALTYLLVGMLGAAAARWWRVSVLSPALIAGTAGLLVQTIRLAVRLADGSSLPFAAAAAVALTTATLGAILLPPLIFWQRRLAQRGFR